MAHLSDEQIIFLELQNIPMSRVFDATGLSPGLYQSIMSDLGMIIAYGVSPCDKNGHTLRTSSGHCAICNTSAIEFTRRYKENGLVYVATSLKENLFKVGMAVNTIEARLKSLNETGYGGITDWEMLRYAKCDEAARKEFEIQKHLSKYRIQKNYLRNGFVVNCRELFKCTTDEALKAFKAIIPDSISVNKINNVCNDTNALFLINRIIVWHEKNKIPHFNINIVFGMKKNIENGHTASKKQHEALKNITIKWKI